MAGPIILKTAECGAWPAVWAARHRLSQVFENLIGNALKFTGRGGRITVAAEGQENEVRFLVGDSGTGISPEHLPHVFDRFWQARHAARHGAGLGLPIVKGIVEVHGGRIQVESTLGSDTSFFISIPRADRKQATTRLVAQE
jgi:signal transduction histidine kinase